MTRLAVEPPTMLLCCIFFYLARHNNAAGQIAVASAFNGVEILVGDEAVEVGQDDALDLGAGEFNFHFIVL
jgi:hypothetical protein